jgi:hypothetical protein
MELEYYFNIKGSDLNKYIKLSFLKNRIVYNKEEKIHLQLFLIKDNEDTLPPKELLKSRTIKVIHNEEEYFTDEYWYEYIDKKLFKRLEKYKILECLKETFAKPMQTRRLLYKSVNPLFSHKTTIQKNSK